MKILFFIAIYCLTVIASNACTVTTVLGEVSPKSFCSGDLIFEDNFDTLDHSKWAHKVSMAGGGNAEFQWYVNDRANSFTTDGNLHLKPTYTADVYSEAFLNSGHVEIPSNECSEGCEREGSPDSIINPIRSAYVSTKNSFSFKYGTLEIRAKMPLGDWLWPALWLYSTHEVYGRWPISGEIDMAHGRGNQELYYGKTNVGVTQIETSLHFGPRGDINAGQTTSFKKHRSSGFHTKFHKYKMIWTPENITFYIDNDVIGTVYAVTGFWERGNFQKYGIPNPWEGGSIMAPFDQEFHIIMNNAVGGRYFCDCFDNYNNGKPWWGGASHGKAMSDFWNGRQQWESSWNRHQSDQSHLQIDYVRVWAL